MADSNVDLEKMQRDVEALKERLPKNANVKQTISAMHEAGWRLTPPGFLQVPQTRDEALAMKLLAEQYFIASAEVTDAQLLAMATGFELMPRNLHADVGNDELRELRVEKRGDDAWTIISDGQIFNKRKQWEWEMMPSSRSDAFLKRARFASAREAIDFARKHLMS